jgi:hypothetical protein
MTIGGSIFLIIAGAILRFAVTAEVAGVDLQTVGLILMIGGALGLVIGLAMVAAANRRPAVDGRTNRPPDPPAY